MIVSVKKEIRMQIKKKERKKKKNRMQKKKNEQILDTKWQINETGETGWRIWPKRETDHVIFDAY